MAWEAARRAALAVGLVESEYFPLLAISALGGYKSVGVPIPQEPRLRRLLPLRPGPGGSGLESAMAAARLRSSRERVGRREGAPAGREPRVQSQAPTDRLRRAARASTASPASARGSRSLRSSLDAARAVRGGDGEPSAEPGSPRVPSSRWRDSKRPGHLRAGGSARQGARRAGDPRGEYRHPAHDADPGDRFLGAAAAGASSRIRSRRPSIARSRSDPTSSPGSRRCARPRPSSAGRAPPTGRRCRWSAMSARSWAARGSPQTGSQPDGSEQPSPATASACRSSGSSSTAERVSAASSWPSRRVGPPRTRSRRRATAPSAKSGRRTPTSSWPSGASTSRPRWWTPRSNRYEDSLRSYRVGLGTLTDLLAARRGAESRTVRRARHESQLLESSAALAFTTGRDPGHRTAPDR